MKREVVYPALLEHLRRFFKGHRRHEYAVKRSRTRRVPSRFRVIRVAPGPKHELHLYLSLGAWEIDHSPHDRREFFLITDQPEMRAIELLATAAHQHRTSALSVGDTFPLGSGWLVGSECDHMLVSLPYPFGPELEVCSLGEEAQVRLLWLLPITEAEKRFREEHGLEALEQRFEQARVNYAFAWRRSLV